MTRHVDDLTTWDCGSSRKPKMNEFTVQQVFSISHILARRGSGSSTLGEREEGMEGGSVMVEEALKVANTRPSQRSQAAVFSVHYRNRDLYAYLRVSVRPNSSWFGIFS